MEGRTYHTPGAYYTSGTHYAPGTHHSPRSFTNRIGALLLALLLVSMLPMTVQASTEDPLQALAAYAGCDYVDILTSDMVVPGESVSDWIAIATGCSGNPVKRNAYLKGLEDYVTAEYEKNGCLHNIKATEYHRISLAVLALGGDPTCFGTDSAGEPINLIAEGTYGWENSNSLGMQGLNGWIFALITLDAKYYDVPDDAVYTREDILAAIPGGSKLAGATVDEKQMKRTEAIIQSMTRKERANPGILNASRRKRIARGSGTSVQEVNRLMNQFEQMKKMIKMMQGGGKRGRRGMPFPF